MFPLNTFNYALETFILTTRTFDPLLEKKVNFELYKLVFISGTKGRDNNEDKIGKMTRISKDSSCAMCPNFLSDRSVGSQFKPEIGPRPTLPFFFFLSIIRMSCQQWRAES
jgi:hypothetical protein